MIMMSRFALTLAACATLAVAVHAQPRGGNNRGNAARGGAQGGTFQLPEGVNRITSIDSHNYILAEEGQGAQRTYSAIKVQHLYSGGIAKLFGGSSVPTDQFVSPAQTGGANGGGRGRGGFAGGGGMMGMNGGMMGGGMMGGMGMGGMGMGGMNMGGMGGNTGFGGFGGNFNR